MNGYSVQAKQILNTERSLFHYHRLYVLSNKTVEMNILQLFYQYYTSKYLFQKSIQILVEFITFSTIL